MKRILVWTLGALLLVLAATAGWLYYSVSQPYRGYEGAEQFVEIPTGSGSAAMGRRLAEAGVVRSATTFRIAVWLQGSGRRLQAGDYRFDRPMSASEVADKIARGDVYTRAITFREGLTIREMAAQFESGGFGAASDFIEAARNAELIRNLDPHARDLEGYLFPDTYMLPRRATAADLVGRMVARFQKVMTPELQQQAAQRGLSVRELVTLASLVEKETGKPEERTIIAGVYTNRLRIGMGLQCDPTVIYALMLAGRYDGNIRREDLRIDSPYNTYRYAGLPPGPIAAPGEASLHAAANPADVPYLYFVSRNDGSHVFSTTYEEHNRAVDEFQRRRGSRP